MQLELDLKSIERRLVITEEDWIGDRKERLVVCIRENVPFYIVELIENGKPHGWKERLEKTQEVICEKGDILQYPCKQKTDEANHILHELCWAIAFMSFYPGGISIFGYRFEVQGCSL